MNNETELSPFHLAIPVDDLEKSRGFYGGLMGCVEGRSSSQWIDFNFFGHQLVCHLDRNSKQQSNIENPVDGHRVPVPHFGVVMNMPEWESLKEKLVQAKVTFILEPYIRFKGLPGEQATMFLKDPAGNALEFKAFENRDKELFAK
ncbi:MAG: VOC family protein [bacterium]